MSLTFPHIYIIESKQTIKKESGCIWKYVKRQYLTSFSSEEKLFSSPPTTSYHPNSWVILYFDNWAVGTIWAIFCSFYNQLFYYKKWLIKAWL